MENLKDLEVFKKISLKEFVKSGLTSNNDKARIMN